MNGNINIVLNNKQKPCNADTATILKLLIIYKLDIFYLVLKGLSQNSKFPNQCLALNESEKYRVDFE